MNTTPQLDIHDMVEELTRTHTHREPYLRRTNGTTWTAGHVTNVPALINQLLGATPASQGSDSGSTSFGSRPAARIEAIDTLMLIDDEASRWVRDLGEDDPGDTLDKATGRPIRGSGTRACITMLHGLHASAEHCGSDRGTRGCCTKHSIEHAVRRWWHQARIASGWDSPSWRPNNTCPVCEQRQSLRVNLIAQTAMCIECREVWTPEEIGLLAEWIRAENADLDDDQDTPLAEGA